MEKSKKIDIEFCLTDDSVNVYGYRLITAGLELDRFNPPIGFLMHNREQGVAVRWDDFRIAEGKLFAKPIVNLVKFPDLADQIENGFYNAASVGHIVALEVSNDDSRKLEGQTGPTVLRWFPRECSIVDIPGNYSSIAKLYDEQDNVLHDLTAQAEIFNNPMEYILNPEHIAMLNLAAGASPESITAVLKDLIERADRTDRAEAELSDLKAKATRQRVELIVNRALEERRISKLLATKLIDAFADKPDQLQEIIDTMPKQSLLTDSLTTDAIPDNIKGKSFQQLFEAGLLEEVRTNFPDYYNQIKPQL